MAEVHAQTAATLAEFARALEATAGLEARADELSGQADRLTRRLQSRNEPPSHHFDPADDLRRQASRLRHAAQSLHDEAASRAAVQLRALGEIAAGIGGSTGATRGAIGGFGLPSPGDILDAIGDAFEDVVDWTGDRAADFHAWAEARARDLVDWTGDRLDDVEGFVAPVLDELRWQALGAQARFDFAAFLAVGDAPAPLPPMDEGRRKTRNLWSYALIPLIEENGGSCATVENGLVACHSPGVELPVVDVTVPLNGRGGTTFGEVFVTDNPVTYERMVAGELPELAAHEQAHSVQWALWGFADFPVAYLLDAAASGNRGERQYFEIQAGLEDGGYGG